MAKLGMNFDATQVEPNTGPLPPLPTDWYNVMITESEMKETKSKDGAYLELAMKVLDGPYANRMVFDRLNLYNPNQVAVEIAQKTLSAICHAVGVFQVEDSQVLHGKPLMARVVEKAAQGGYDASNDVKGYAKPGERESKNGAGIKLEPQHTGSPTPPAQPRPSGGPGATPSWAGTATAQPPATAGWGGGAPAPAAPPAAAPQPEADSPSKNDSSGDDSRPPWMRNG